MKQFKKLQPRFTHKQKLLGVWHTLVFKYIGFFGGNFEGGGKEYYLWSPIRVSSKTACRFSNCVVVPLKVLPFIIKVEALEFRNTTFHLPFENK